ncbi:cytosolic enolase 3 [Oryza brachyantha]|uniref:phosphopyruvate hydratase n=1 Tax=Oryza brachyantha TaxID=4533 RepID=J3LMB4_ORYBR|nr:cytosolic enolase 3 [Oryza brachyantha]
MSVQEYLEKHLLSRKIEEAVNAAVRAKAPDPVLSISNHMRRAAPAVITSVRARQILDGRGETAVEVSLHTNKAVHRASAASADAPEGTASEAARDAEKRKLLARAVADAVRVINDKVSEALVGMDPQQQSQIDQAIMDLDKAHHKAEIGVNAMLAVSIAACKAGAAEKEVPLYKHIAELVGKSATTLPVPVITVINGGTHAGNSLPIQEIMILPVGAKNFEEAMQMGSETYHHLKDIILEKYGSNSCNIGDDGGFAPNISSISEGLDLVIEAINRAGYNGRIKLAIDVAATDFCIGKKYDLEFKFAEKSGQGFKTADDLIEIYSQLCSEYPLVSIEQPFDKDDWEHSKKFTTLELCQVVGDDLLMSDPERIKRAVNEYTCNALVLKANQVGTVTEAMEVVRQAKDAHWGVMVSHRSGDTDDSFIADLAVGAAAGQIKAGAPCRGECLSKYNQLLRIEEELGSDGVYAGENWRTAASTS